MLGRRDEALAEAAKLLLRGDVQEHLDQANAIIDEYLLKGIDLIIRPPPFVRARQSFDAFDEDSPVPSSVKDRDIARRRQSLPKAPKKVAPLLLGAGLPIGQTWTCQSSVSDRELVAVLGLNCPLECYQWFLNRRP